MLDDPRSQALVDNFARQWLYLRNIEVAKPDPDAFPEFDETLRDAFRQETALFFQNILREDHSVLELLDVLSDALNTKGLWRIAYTNRREEGRSLMPRTASPRTCAMVFKFWSSSASPSLSTGGWRCWRSSPFRSRSFPSSGSPGG